MLFLIHEDNLFQIYSLKASCISGGESSNALKRMTHNRNLWGNYHVKKKKCEF